MEPHQDDHIFQEIISGCEEANLVVEYEAASFLLDPEDESWLYQDLSYIYNPIDEYMDQPYIMPTEQSPYYLTAQSLKRVREASPSPLLEEMFDTIMDNLDASTHSSLGMSSHSIDASSHSVSDNIDTSVHSGRTDKSSASNKSGGKSCSEPGCFKFSQGRTQYCISHGGGRRCTVPGCSKGARDRFFCVGHGGGKRCEMENCSRSAVGGSKVCSTHGGGKKCTSEGCTKSAQSATGFCVAHGGGKKCTSEGCTKVARGRTPFCSSHGGGMRCTVADCGKAVTGKSTFCRNHVLTDVVAVECAEIIA